MKHAACLTVRTIFLIILLFISPALVSFKPEPARPALQLTPGKRVILRAKPEDVFFHLQPPAHFGRSKAPAAIITVNYVGSWDPSAQVAFEYALDIWASLIVSSVPIVIQAEWLPLGSTILGSAGPATLFRNFSNAPHTNIWYSVALANSLSGSDHNGGNPEIFAEFNQDFPDWYFGLDGAPPSGKYDFVSVALHEIGHGLGFFGTADINNGLGSLGLGSPYPDIYDFFVENLSGQKITDFPSPSLALANQFRGGGGGLFFSGLNATAANNGNRPKLYTPSIWTPGSSYAHLDEDIYDQTVNALMTPAIGSAEAIHTPGPITLGMFQDMGWPINLPPPPLPDLTVTQHLQNPNLNPGDPITIVLTVENKGDAAATNVVLTDILPVEILSPSWTNSASLTGITLQNGPSFIWDLPDLAAGALGTVTINGMLSSNLPADFALVNSATISTIDQETNLDNNSSTIILGGSRLYLPVVYN